MSPQNPEVAEDCLPAFKDFLADVTQGMKGVESALGVGALWSDAAMEVNFDNAGDEKTFGSVAKALFFAGKWVLGVLPNQGPTSPGRSVLPSIPCFTNVIRIHIC
jgi:hypothetical protein